MILNTINDDDDKVENPFIFSNLWLSEEINLVSKMLKQIETYLNPSQVYAGRARSVEIERMIRSRVY
jgi:hypothetical protein